MIRDPAFNPLFAVRPAAPWGASGVTCKGYLIPLTATKEGILPDELSGSIGTPILAQAPDRALVGFASTPSMILVESTWVYVPDLLMESSPPCSRLTTPTTPSFGSYNVSPLLRQFLDTIGERDDEMLVKDEELDDDEDFVMS